jgi:uncharacterized OB-fold protein
MTTSVSSPDFTAAVYARCPVCNEATFPVHTMSPCGHSIEPLLLPLEEAGEVFSWTRTHQADGVTTIAMTDFLGGELRVTAPVLGVDEIAIGDRLVVLTSADGGFVLAPEA